MTNTTRAVTLARDVRTFHRIPNSKRLIRHDGAGARLPVGTPVVLGAFEILLYDHKNQLAAPVYFNGTITSYVLINELCMPELTQ